MTWWGWITSIIQNKIGCILNGSHFCKKKYKIINKKLKIQINKNLQSIRLDICENGPEPGPRWDMWLKLLGVLICKRIFYKWKVFQIGLRLV